MKPGKRRCDHCGRLIPLNLLVKSMDGKRVLEFHTHMDKECRGSMRPTKSMPKEDRDLLRAFTPNKYGELA